MDLWLECISRKFGTFSFGQEYQVIDIDPLHGLICLINNNDNEIWINEKYFKAKREEVKNMKRKYEPILVNINVRGNVVTAEIIHLDKNQPCVKSMNEFLGIPAYFGLDMGIVSIGDNFKITIKEQNQPLNNGVYGSNVKALDFASAATKMITMYNSLLTKIEYEIKKPAYIIQFSPNGKEYTFRSMHNLQAGQTVVCISKTGLQYAVVKKVIELLEEEWETKAFCKPAL